MMVDVNKKHFSVLLLAVMLIISIAPVEAYTVTNERSNVDTSGYPLDNWFGRLARNLFGEEFTSYGVEAQCSPSWDEQEIWINADEIPNTFLQKLGLVATDPDATSYKNINIKPGEKYLINWWYGSPNIQNYEDHLSDDRLFMKEVYLEYGKTASSYAMKCEARAYWDYQCYYEIYKCLGDICYSEFDCGDGWCDTSVLSLPKTPFPAGAGICRMPDYISPTHSTQSFYCEDGTKNPLGARIDGELNFCPNPLDSNYVLLNGDSTGVCTSIEPRECSPAIITTKTKTTLEDPAVEVQLYGLSFGDINDQPITTINPGDQIKVTYYVKSTKVWTTAEKLLLTPQNLYGEVGIVPSNVAEQWNIVTESGLFTSFKMGDSGPGSVINDCCDLQENIQGGYEVIKWGPFSTYGDIKVTAIINVPSELTRDMCNVGVEFYNTNTTEYVVYASVKNGCSKDGYNVGRYLAKDVTVNVDVTPLPGSTGSILEGQRCSENYECASGVCEKPSWLKAKVCVGSGSGAGSTATKVQVGIPAKQVSKTTTEDLLKSLCTSTDDCREGTCQPLNSLRDEGYLSQAEVDEKLTTNRKIFTASAGTLGGIGLCTAIVGTTALASGGVATILLPLCGIAGGATGLSIGNLISGIGSGKGDAYGYCIIEGGVNLDFLEWAAWFDINGDGRKDGTDGAMILGIGVLLLWFLNRRKGEEE